MKRTLRFAAWLAVAAAAIFLAVQLSYLARVWWWKDHNPRTTAFMDARLERLRARDPQAKLQHTWIA
ncbi:MAG: monofunctional biosynthetic peptidoglycan transglycosylase, partial [Usitatibacter sp.]